MMEYYLQYEMLLKATILLNEKVFVIVWSILICFWSGRSIGSRIDKEYRDPGGKAYYVNINSKWRWIYKKINDTYSESSRILLASMIWHLLGYAFSVIEMLLLISGIIMKNTEFMSTISCQILIVYFLFAGIFVGLPTGIMYSHNMRKTYDYDWITDVKEKICSNSKRTCKIVSISQNDICEIKIGYFGRKHRVAKAEKDIPVWIGKRMYAIHVYDTCNPCWIIKEH